MKVKALKACFVGSCRRKEGAVFDYAGSKVPAYLEPVGKSEPVAEAPAETKPRGKKEKPADPTFD